MTAQTAASFNNLLFNTALSSKLFDIPVEIRNMYEDTRAVQANIRGVSMGLFQVCSPVAIAPGQEVEVRYGTRLIHSDVVDCREHGGASYYLKIKLANDGGRRSEPRIRTDLPGHLIIASSGTKMPMRIIDVSHSGLGLQLPSAVPTGAAVSVDFGSAVAEGEVRHCTKQIDVYRAGVRIERFYSESGDLSPVVVAASSGSVHSAVVQAFVRAVQQRQLKYEAILCSLAFEQKIA